MTPEDIDAEPSVRGHAARAMGTFRAHDRQLPLRREGLHAVPGRASAQRARAPTTSWPTRCDDRRRGQERLVRAGGDLRAARLLLEQVLERTDCEAREAAASAPAQAIAGGAERGGGRGASSTRRRAPSTGPRSCCATARACAPTRSCTSAAPHRLPAHADPGRAGKGKKDRTVMLSAEPARGAARVLEALRGPSAILLEGKRPGQPIAATSIQRAFRAARRKTRVRESAVTPRSLRHAFATHLVERGTNLRVVQALLGHQSLNTTAVYTHLAKTWLSEVKSPLDSLKHKDTTRPSRNVSCRERALSVADILRDHVGRLHLDHEQGKAAAHILACRTGRLGGHLAVCDRCGAKHYAYHSCRDRHCPRCGGLDQRLWAEAQLPHLLPVSYFHVVFTLPVSLRRFFLGKHRRSGLGRLLRRRLRVDPRDRGHGVGSSPASSPCSTPGINNSATTRTFTVSSPAVGSAPRLRPPPPLPRPPRNPADGLQGQAALQAPGAPARRPARASPSDSGHERLRDASRRTWNIDIRRPFGGPEQVVNYFARYVRKIAISDHRLVELRRTDRRLPLPRPQRTPTASRPPSSTRRPSAGRFLQHVLPAGFVRIRRYGLLSNRVRKPLLERCRELLGADPPLLLAPPGESRVERPSPHLRLRARTAVRPANSAA